jgi:hypothetical protein
MIRAASLAGTVLAAPLLGAAITPAPSKFVFDGDVSEWKGRPPTAQAVNAGSLWIGQSKDGLVIAGTALRRTNVANPATVIIRLSVADRLDLPEIPWDCERPDNQKDRNVCLAWVKEQTDFRDKIERLFTREWQITPQGSGEIRAGFAWDALTEFQRKSLDLPRPAGQPLYKYKAGLLSVEFEIVIPWELFPPARQLDIDRIRLNVNSGGVGTGVPDGEQPREMSLSPPVVSHITPCNQPLQGRFIGEDSVPAFYFLTASRDVREAFFFENPRRDGWATVPGPTDISPVANRLGFFAQTLGQGEYLCGPYLTYVRGLERRPLADELWPWVGGLGGGHSTVLPVRRLADGTLLIQAGPVAYWGPLWARAIFDFTTHILAVSPQMDVHEALRLQDTSDFLSNYGVDVSDDWKTVTEFKKRLDEWSSETYCLKGGRYESCRKNPNSRPPMKPLIGE